MQIQLSFSKILLAFFAFIGLMIAARVIYSGEYRFIFLIWNLFLAWIPFALSTTFKKMHQSSSLKQGLLFFVWLLFFPNALYMVTDLIHLNMQTNVPKWFDAVLLFTAAIVALLMALIAILRVEKYLAIKIKARFVPAAVLGILFLGSFGVYLGRFLRLNSWNFLSNPLPLFIAVAERFVFPLAHVRTWSVTFLLTVLFYLLFLALKKLPGYINQAA